MNDDTIIKQRIGGRSVRAIAKTNGCSVAEVNRVLDLFANATITDQVRKHTLALELARLDELQEAFYEQAMGGDVQSGALVAKIIERRRAALVYARHLGAAFAILHRRDSFACGGGNWRAGG